MDLRGAYSGHIVFRDVEETDPRGFDLDLIFENDHLVVLGKEQVNKQEA